MTPNAGTTEAGPTSGGQSRLAHPMVRQQVIAPQTGAGYEEALPGGRSGLAQSRRSGNAAAPVAHFGQREF